MCLDLVSERLQSCLFQMECLFFKEKKERKERKKEKKEEKKESGIERMHESYQTRLAIPLLLSTTGT